MAIHECATTNELVPCGCEVARCSVCGAAQSVRKCAFHSPKTHDSKTYYLEELHGNEGGVPRHTKVCAELLSALGAMGLLIPEGTPSAKRVLEIGAGIGIYAPLFMGLGYRYEAVEPDTWAARYIKGAYSPHVHCIPFEAFPDGWEFDGVIAAHCLEHFYDAKKMLEKMASLLTTGGRLYLIVPNDRDLGNPDHKWFFTGEAIRLWLKEAGLEVKGLVQKSVVVWEDFIYAVAEKA